MSLDEFGDQPPTIPKPSGKEGSMFLVPPDTRQSTLITDDGETVEYESGPCQWSVLQNDRVFSASRRSVKALPPGMYRCSYTNDGALLLGKQPVNIDELLEFPGGFNANVLNQIDFFWSRKKEFESLGYLHRRGFLFYGPQGGGKSCLVAQINAQLIKQGGLVLLCDHPKMLSSALGDIRVIEPDRRIICLFEDIDTTIEVYGEPVLLSLLDGENQITNVLNIATTNYPEKLPKRLVARPRRFDMVIRVDWPTPEVRAHYFKHKLKIDEAELGTWVKATDKFSFAAMAELVISVKCLGKSFEESVRVLSELTTLNHNSCEYDGSGKVGFAV